MQILLVGVNHETAPLSVRETVSFSKEQLPDALSLLKRQVGEAVILSTCNRTEVYAASENPQKTADRIRRFLADFHEVKSETVRPYLYYRVGEEAVRHLFRVSSGLDAMILGESQILGQVRDSLTAASESRSVGVSLVGLFHAAVRAGRRVRQETDLGRNALSVSYAGVRLAQRVLGTLNGLRVLLIGAGEAGQLVASALRTVGVNDLLIANRTRARGQELAENLDGRIVEFSDIADSIGDADIVIAATDSPEFIITSDMVASALSERNKGVLFMFDLAMTRDIDPEAASHQGVRLFNIDDLASIAEENLEERKRAAIDAEACVEEDLTRFMKWWDSLDAMPIIRTLRQQAEELRQRELSRALRKLPDL